MENLIRRKSLAEVVADKLRDLIKAGKYPLNEKLPTEPELMEAFGVGRSTVREAIKILANSGLLHVKQGAGTFVKRLHSSEPLESRLQRAEISDLIEVRELLELKIAEKTAQYRTPENLAKMKSFLKQRKDFARAGKTEECIEADVSFHLAIAEGCGNQILLDLYRSVSRHVSALFTRQFNDTLKFTETQQLHEDLFRQIRSGNAEKALSAAEKIIGQI